MNIPDDAWNWNGPHLFMYCGAVPFQRPNLIRARTQGVGQCMVSDVAGNTVSSHLGESRDHLPREPRASRPLHATPSSLDIDEYHLVLARILPCMASLQTIHLTHLPPDLAVHVALYTNVENAFFLHEQLLQGNPDFECALIDASTVRRRRAP